MAIVLHPDSGNVEIDGLSIHLPPRLWQIFERLWRSRPECVSISRLRDMLDADRPDALDAGTLKRHIFDLRKRLAMSSLEVVTVDRFGYCLRTRRRQTKRRRRMAGLI